MNCREEEDPLDRTLKESSGGSSGGGALDVHSTVIEKITLSSSVSSRLSTEAVTCMSAAHPAPARRRQIAGTNKKIPAGPKQDFLNGDEEGLPVFVMVHKHILHLALHLPPRDFFQILGKRTEPALGFLGSHLDHFLQGVADGLILFGGLLFWCWGR